MENQNTIRELFARYLEDKCSGVEIELLLRYFNKDTQDVSLTQQISQVLETNSGVKEMHSEAVREVYNVLRGQIAFTKDQHVKPLGLWFGKISRMAAIWVVLLLSAGGMFYYFSKNTKTDQPSKLIQVSAKKGEQKKIALKDGSIIWLNSEAVIEYPETFSADAREITLHGEAYFQVKSDRQRPFTVHTGNIKTRVLGTSFNIRANPHDTLIAVSVLTGKVQVSTGDVGESVDLLPDQQAVYKKASHQLVVNDEVNATALISWKEGKMQFRNQTIEEVIAYLSARYHVEITCNPNIRNCPVRADFNENESVDLVLQMLVMSLDGKVIHHGNSEQYFLQGTGCP